MTTLTELSDRLCDDFEAVLRAAIAERPPEYLRAKVAEGCWIYGAGEYGQQLLAVIQAAGFPIKGFIDRRGGPAFAECLGLSVTNPDAFTAEMASGVAFIGAVVNPEGGTTDILPWARQFPFSEFLSGADLPDALGAAANTFWQGSRRYLLDNIGSLRASTRKLADAQSIESIYGVLKYRVTNDAAHHPADDLENMYLPLDLPGFDRPITFIDGGAYIGDTCAFMLDKGVKLDRYVAFEPDQANLARLTKWLRTAPVGEATVIPAGLADQAREFRFMPSKGPSSRISDDPDVETVSVKCFALDDMLPGIKPDFIKLDIEGSEMSALKGMQRTIERTRPRMTICLYHRPGDLWEIPDWVGQFYDKLYVRQHGAFGWDTILYAFPNEERRKTDRVSLSCSTEPVDDLDHVVEVRR